MASNRFLVILLLLSFFYTTIFGIRWGIHRKPPTVSRDCRDKSSSCSSYKSYGYCESHKGWMKKNCAKTCGICTSVRPTKSCRDNARVCSRYPSNGYCYMTGSRGWMKQNCGQSCGFCGPQWFQIHSSAYKKCLAARRVVNTRGAFVTAWTELSLRDCAQDSFEQNWRWTADGRLQLAFKRKCLTVTFTTSYRGRTYGISLQPCTSRRWSQQWTCTSSGYLKLNNRNLYLLPVPSRRRGRFSVKVTNRITNNCRWSRYGSTKSLCDYRKSSTTSNPTTNQITTPTTTEMHTTTIVPPTRSTLPPPSVSTTAIGSQNPWFQIRSAAFNKCVALRNRSKLAKEYRSWAPLLTLETCDINSSRQLWQWAGNGRLRLSYNGKCLVSNVYNVPRFRPCNTVSLNKGWSCDENKLRWGNRKLYLLAFMYSGLPFDYNVRTIRWTSCGRNTCDWSRAETGRTVCDNGKTTATVPPSTPEVTTPKTTTNLPSTTTKPPSTTNPTTTNPPSTMTASSVS